MKKQHRRAGFPFSGRRLTSSQDGATAVEFAILAPVFFLLIGATLETALSFFAGQALDSAVNDSARLVRTGQAQTMNADSYRADICGRLYSLFDCDQLQISVRPVVSFSSFTAASPVDEDTGDWTIAQQFDPGSATEIVLVEAYYKWPAVFTMPALTVGLLPDHTRLLGAARLFRNEPF